MLEDLSSHEEVARLTDRLLRNAHAYGRLPTPVADILAAAELVEAPQSFLSASSIAQAPAHLRGILSRMSGKVHAVLDRRTAELLFQRDRFATIASDYAVSSGAVIELAQRFGSSIHAAFRRYVETHRGAVAGVVLATGPCEREPLAFARKEAICSDSWRQRFEDPAVWPRVLRADPFAFVEQARACAGFGPPEGEWRYLDRNNEMATLNVEAMSNTYRTFVLVWLPQRERFKRRRVIASAA